MLVVVAIAVYMYLVYRWRLMTKEELETAEQLCQNIPFGSVANPRDCHSYYQCMPGTHLLLRCPAGFYYNEEEQRCTEDTCCGSRRS